jgi:hypothetical protein
MFFIPALQCNLFCHTIHRLICGIIATAGQATMTSLGVASMVLSGIALVITLMLVLVAINGSIIAELIIGYQNAKDCITIAYLKIRYWKLFEISFLQPQ